MLYTRLGGARGLCCGVRTMTDAIGFISVERCTAASVQPHEWWTFWELWAVRAPGEVYPREQAIAAPLSGMSWMGLIVQQALSGRLSHLWPGHGPAELRALCWCAFCGVRGHRRLDCTVDPLVASTCVWPQAVLDARAASKRPAVASMATLLRSVAAPFEAVAVVEAEPAGPAELKRSSSGGLRSVGAPPALSRLSSRRRKAESESSPLATRGGGKRRRQGDPDSDDELIDTVLKSTRRGRGRKIVDKSAVSWSPDRVASVRFGASGAAPKPKFSGKKWWESQDVARGVPLNVQ